ncbi:MAG: MoaD/ThiS family protein [Chloroflexi bacterium]|nr:MoaD/ThiS family protein [Chloroflexota bacterium]
MKISVRFYAQLRKYHPGPNRSVPLEVELADGQVIAELVARLNLPSSLVRAAFVNGQASSLGDVLHDGDQVSLFSPVVGGVERANA